MTDQRAVHSDDGEAARVPLDAGRVLELSTEIQRYPGKRIICHGCVDGQPVVAKFYLGRLRGWWEWLRGLRGTRALVAADVPTARLVFAGFRAQAGAWLTVVEYIAADESWPPPGPDEDPRGHERAHGLLIRTLADLHAAGLVQNDLNWTNFIPRTGILHAIDGDRVRAHPAPLGREPSLGNLRRLYAYKADFGHDAIRRGYQHYCEARGWNTAEREFSTLLCAIHRERRRVGDQFVRRSLTGWKHFPSGYSGPWRVIRDQRRISTPAVDQLIAALEATASCADAPQRVEGVDTPLRIQAITPTRDGVSARRAWSRALLFRRLRIPAERPAALIEPRGWFRRAGGYLVTCRCETVPLGDALSACNWMQQQTKLHRLGEVLALLWLADLEFTHMDASMFAVVGSALIVRHPEQTRSRARAPYPAPDEELVAALAHVCGHSEEEIRAAIASGIGAAAPRP